YGNFVVVELCPASPYDKDEVIGTIKTTFPLSSPLPNTSSCSQMLRWKIPFPEKGSITQHLDVLKGVIRMLPLRESCIIRAPLDVVVQNAIDVLNEGSKPEKKG
ncbi:hypothetical protein GCK32_019353, partial [Trichostrongylus colubriformis]